MPVIKHSVLCLPLSYKAIVGVSPMLHAILLILHGATECECLSASCLVLYVFCSLPMWLTSWSVADFHGRGCMVFHIWISSVDFWGEAFFPKIEKCWMQECLQLHCQIQKGIKLLVTQWCCGLCCSWIIGKWSISHAASIYESPGFIVLSDIKIPVGSS